MESYAGKLTPLGRVLPTLSAIVVRLTRAVGPRMRLLSHPGMIGIHSVNWATGAEDPRQPRGENQSPASHMAVDRLSLGPESAIAIRRVGMCPSSMDSAQVRAIWEQ